MKRPRDPPPPSSTRGPLSLSADRVESILRDFRGYDESPRPPGRQYPAYRRWRGGWTQHPAPASRKAGGAPPRGGLGTELRPRASTHPAVDEAAQSVAEAILGERGNQAAFHRSLEMYVLHVAVGASGARCAVAGGTPVAMAHEWDVPRILNDRVWDWMQHMAFRAPPQPHLKNGHVLPRGRLEIDLYHRCHAGCGRANLLCAEARGETPHALVACPASGIVHLCRARADSCASLQETADTQLVCRTSGLVCMEAGVAASQEIGDVNQERHMRTVEYGLDARAPSAEGEGEASEAGEAEGESEEGAEGGADRREVDMLCRRGRPDVTDPENARRARAVDGMCRAGCPQIVEWDREMGRLVLDLRVVPRAGEAHFDPTFYWAAAAPAQPPAAAPALAAPREELGGAPGRQSAFERTVAASMARMDSERRSKRSLRAKRARNARRRFGRPDAGLVDREREEIESVLDDLLWDAETRARVNAEGRAEAERLAAAAVAERMQRHSVPDLFLSVIEGAEAPRCGGGARREILSAGAAQGAALHAARHLLVPVVPFRRRVHEALVHAILYLWTLVVHEPAGLGAALGGGASGGASGGQQAQRARRNTDVRTVSLSQFVLGFLYTAADSGVQVANRGGWPRDWWLKDHLPDVKVIDRFGSGRGAARARALREAAAAQGDGGEGGAGGRDRVLATWANGGGDKGGSGGDVGGGSGGEGAAARSRRQVAVCIYQARTVTMGKRTIARAVCQYAGAIPTPDAVRGVLQKDFAAAYMVLGRGGVGQQGGEPELPPHRRAFAHHHTALARAPTMSALQPYEHALWQRQRQRQGGGEAPAGGGAPPLCFSCMYVLSGGRAHICVTYDPYDPAGPPGLERDDRGGDDLDEFDMDAVHPPAAAAAGPAVDTVVGPFVREADARQFAIEWAKGLRSLGDRRRFGIDLAQRVGLRVWHTPRGAGAADGLRPARSEYLFPHQHRRRAEEAEAAAGRRAIAPAGPSPSLAAFRSLVRGADGWGGRPLRAAPAPMDLSG